MFKKCIAISIPRSGHHLFINTVRDCFGFNEFLYCEMYNADGCCKKIPCDYINYDNSDRFIEYKQNLKLFIQKSHDLDFEVPFNADFDYVIQLRDPVDAAIAHFRWLLNNSIEYSFSDARNFIFNYLFYYIVFYHKWCIKNKNVCIVRYEDISDLESSSDNYSNFFKFIGVNVDLNLVNDSIRKNLKIDSHVGAPTVSDGLGYDSEYYFKLFGIDLNWYRKVISLLLPEFNYYYDIVHNNSTHPLDDYYFLIDLTGKSKFTLDFMDHKRKLEEESIKSKKGIGLFAPFGLSHPEVSVGAWSVSDVLFLPMKISQGVNNFVGSIFATLRADLLNIDAWEIYLVINSTRIDIFYDFVKSGLSLIINFKFSLPLSDEVLYGGFFINFKGLDNSNFTDHRKLGIQIKNVEFTKVE